MSTAQRLNSIDEDSFLRMVAGELPSLPEAAPVEPSAGPLKTPKAKPATAPTIDNTVLSDYEFIFLKQVVDASEFRKTINVPTELHCQLQKIVERVFNNTVSLSSFVTNILLDHITKYTDMYDAKYTPPKKWNE